MFHIHHECCTNCVGCGSEHRTWPCPELPPRPMQAGTVQGGSGGQVPQLKCVGEAFLCTSAVASECCCTCRWSCKGTELSGIVGVSSPRRVPQRVRNSNCRISNPTGVSSVQWKASNVDFLKGGCQFERVWAKTSSRNGSQPESA